MKKMKKLLLFVPLIAVLAFSGCMTDQVEIRMEYDKLTKAITAAEDKRSDYLKPAVDESVKEILGFIYDTAKQAKASAEAAGLKDAAISLTTMGFKVESVSKTEKTADAYFALIIAGTAADDTASSSPVMLLSAFNPSAPIAVNFHKYKVSNDSDEIPVYNLIYTYVKAGGEWKISGIKDGSSALYPLEELMAS